MWLITILKVTKKQGFTRRYIFGKNTGQTQTIHRLWQTNCLTVFDHFVGLALKGLKQIFHWQSPYATHCIIFRVMKTLLGKREKDDLSSCKLGKMSPIFLNYSLTLILTQWEQLINSLPLVRLPSSLINFFICSNYLLNRGYPIIYFIYLIAQKSTINK